MVFLIRYGAVYFFLSVEFLDLAQLWASTLLHWAYNSVQYLDWSLVLFSFLSEEP
jgi:hypothetical protein